MPPHPLWPLATEAQRRDALTAAAILLDLPVARSQLVEALLRACADDAGVRVEVPPEVEAVRLPSAHALRWTVLVVALELALRGWFELALCLPRPCDHAWMRQDMHLQAQVCVGRMANLDVAAIAVFRANGTVRQGLRHAPPTPEYFVPGLAARLYLQWRTSRVRVEPEPPLHLPGPTRLVWVLASLAAAASPESAVVPLVRDDGVVGRLLVKRSGCIRRFLASPAAMARVWDASHQASRLARVQRTPEDDAAAKAYAELLLSLPRAPPACPLLLSFGKPQWAWAPP